VRVRFSIIPHPLEIGGPGQAKTTLHPSLTLCNGTRCLRLPANFLDVIIDFHRQLVTTSLAAALENVTPISGRHALAKAVNAHTAANFGLVSTFCSHELSSQI